MQRRIQQYERVIGLVIVAVLVIVAMALLLWSPGSVGATVIQNERTSSYAGLKVDYVAPLLQEGEPAHPPSDQACRLCHADSTSVIQFPSGENLPVLVDLETLEMSAHGQGSDQPLSCTACHSPSDYQIPHSPVEAEDLREFQIARSANCERCHQEPHLTSHPGPESETPVVCTDCHGSHDVLTAEQLLTGEGTTACVDCHANVGVELADPVALSQIIRDGLFSQKVDNDYCLACHSQPGRTLSFENGDEISITVDRDAFHNSVHGADNSWQELACSDCHGRYTYPHPAVGATSAREYTLTSNQVCEKCHEQNSEKNLDSVHGAALAEGNIEAAVCTDCHGAHDTQPPDEPRERISHTCEKCHSTIFDRYAESVHGEALLADSNPDVATCIDCHGVHNIGDPTTDLARLNSPQLCAKCHADEALMAKYDISTDVFETYVADFHGKTVTLFDSDHPEAIPNEAVCFDCHGVHDIRAVDDPENGIKANLLETCQQCHPNATANFSDAWTSHYVPSLQHSPLVYLVDTFYALVIPLTLGGLGFLIATDIFRRIRIRIKR